MRAWARNLVNRHRWDAGDLIPPGTSLASIRPSPWRTSVDDGTKKERQTEEHPPEGNSPWSRTHDPHPPKNMVPCRSARPQASWRAAQSEPGPAPHAAAPGPPSGTAYISGLSLASLAAPNHTAGIIRCQANFAPPSLIEPLMYDDRRAVIECHPSINEWWVCSKCRLWPGHARPLGHRVRADQPPRLFPSALHARSSASTSRQSAAWLPFCSPH